MVDIAFVTGADRGLGFVLMTQLLEAGWRVFGGQYLPEWTDLVALTGRYPERLTLVPRDVSSKVSVRAAATVRGATERNDLLISNDGVNSPTSPRMLLADHDWGRCAASTRTMRSTS